MVRQHGPGVCNCHSAEARAKRSASLRGRQCSGETRKKLSESLRSSEAFAEYNTRRVGHSCAAGCDCGRHTSQKPDGFGVGRFVSEETRDRIAVSVAKAHERGDWDKYRSTGPGRKRTNLEEALAGLLEDFGFRPHDDSDCSCGSCYREQVRFGRYVTDFYVPALNTVYEADGSFWSHHQDKDREARRDEYLRDTCGVAEIAHFTEDILLNRGRGTSSRV